MGSILHTVAYSGMDLAFGQKTCRTMYNGSPYGDRLEQLACFAQSLAEEFW